MIWSHRGPTITKHNDICANWISEVCRNVEREPCRRREHCAFCKQTQQCKSRHLCNSLLGTSTVYIFWCYRAFHPNTQSYCHSSISSLYWRHEQAKKREYGDKISKSRMVFSLHLCLPQPEPWVRIAHGKAKCYGNIAEMAPHVQAVDARTFLSSVRS